MSSFFMSSFLDGSILCPLFFGELVDSSWFVYHWNWILADQSQWLPHRNCSIINLVHQKSYCLSLLLIEYGEIGADLESQRYKIKNNSRVFLNNLYLQV
jgi:urease accessory protein UreH